MLVTGRQVPATNLRLLLVVLLKLFVVLEAYKNTGFFNNQNSIISIRQLLAVLTLLDHIKAIVKTINRSMHLTTHAVNTCAPVMHYKLCMHIHTKDDV